MKIVLAIDSFKGCLTSVEANQAAAEGIRAVRPDAEVVQVPVSDGGEGFLEAFHAALGGEMVIIGVRDPLMRRISARYLLKGDTAVIEMAQACGLTLLSADERNPLLATSYGVGQLIADAVRRGVSHIIVGLGGSATSDAGTGMLRALIDAFAPHGTWDDVQALPCSPLLRREGVGGGGEKVRFTIASDVQNPLCGANGAAHVFAPQKGATPEMVSRLDARARRFAEVSARHFGYDRSQQPGAGAAGGLGYAFLQYLDADCQPGIRLLLDALHFRELISDATLIITGEGAADRQTLMGKLPMGILQQSHGIPVALIAGRISDRDRLLRAGFAKVKCINPAGLPQEVAMQSSIACRNIAETVSQLLFP